MPNWAAACRAFSRSREAMAAISHQSPCCMAGITFLRAIRAAPRTPQRTLRIMGSISNALRYSIALGKGDTPWTKLESHGECGTNEPLGYVVLQQGVRLDRPVQAYDKWINRRPG